MRAVHMANARISWDATRAAASAANPSLKLFLSEPDSELPFPCTHQHIRNHVLVNQTTQSESLNAEHPASLLGIDQW